jgi:hypothetical protein
MRGHFLRAAAGRLLLYPAYVQDYLDRVTAADVTAGNSLGLERSVTDAASAFLQDLVSISYLGISSNVISQAASVIKAMPIMAGARTLAGAWVPVVGPAPTNFNFVSGDYNRKTGLVGDGSTKRLDLNRLGTADPRDSKHAAIYVSTAATSASAVYPIYIGTPSVPSTIIFREPSNGNLGFRCGTTSPDSVTAGGSTGFIGVNRSSSSNFTLRASAANQTFTRASEVVASSQSFWLYGNNANSNCNARIAFYSIGESINLALLDARVTTLINAYAAAIP